MKNNDFGSLPEHWRSRHVEISQTQPSGTKLRAAFGPVPDGDDGHDVCPVENMSRVSMFFSDNMGG